MKLAHWLCLVAATISWWANTSRPICNTKHILIANIILFVAVSDDDYSDRFSVSWWWCTLSVLAQAWMSPQRAGIFSQVSDDLFSRYSSASSSLYLDGPFYLVLSGVTLHLHRQRPLIPMGTFYLLETPWSGGGNNRGWSAPALEVVLVSAASTLLLPCAAPDVFSNYWLNNTAERFSLPRCAKINIKLNKNKSDSTPHRQHVCLRHYTLIGLVMSHDLDLWPLVL